MYKGKFASELSINEVKEYYDELRQKCPRTEEQWADFNILQEKLIVFAYKILDGKTNGDLIKAMFPDVLEKQLQEPCEDAISRQAALDEIRKCRFVVDAIEKIRGLPPVTSQLKTGKWTNGDRICPCCGEDKFKDLDADIWSDWQPKFCPNCGAKMIEPQGRSDKAW